MRSARDPGDALLTFEVIEVITHLLFIRRLDDLQIAMPTNERHTNGDLYEYMLSKVASAGTNGQVLRYGTSSR